MEMRRSFPTGLLAPAKQGQRGMLRHESTHGKTLGRQMFMVRNQQQEWRVAEDTQRTYTSGRMQRKAHCQEGQACRSDSTTMQLIWAVHNEGGQRGMSLRGQT